jgi:hypothetical protein
MTFQARIIAEERMSEDRSHVAANDAERERLRSLVTRMSDEDLGKAMPDGWTVAAVLAHAAFWDAWAIYFLDKWGPDGEPSVYEDEDADAVNESAKPLCLALPPRDAAELALRLAQESDAKVKTLSDAMLARIRVKGDPPFNLARAHHRKEHLDDIELAFPEFRGGR